LYYFFVFVILFVLTIFVVFSKLINLSFAIVIIQNKFLIVLEIKEICNK